MMFTEALAVAIAKGEKTQTRRRISPKPRSPWREPGGMAHDRVWTYPVGKVFTVNPGRGVTRVAECEVTERRIECLADVRATQAQKEGFRSTLAFRDAWTKINGSFDLVERVHVVTFKLVGGECPTCEGTKLVGPPFIEDPCPDCFGTGVEVSVRARALVAKVEGG